MELGTENARREFCTTHWTAVLNARNSHDEVGREALAELCRVYWFPIYGFVRRRGYDAHAAEDLTQGFLSDFFQSGGLLTVSRENGRFRSFLLASLKNVLNNDWRRSQSQKRGGAQPLISLDAKRADELYEAELARDESPERFFDRHWAHAVLDQVLAKLKEEFDGRDGLNRFEILKVFLLDDGKNVKYADVAARLQLSEIAVKSAIYRLRQRYAELLRSEIAHTVANPSEIDGEIRYLFSILAQ
jgi:RNA polymerase sigma factor (sigma-70 family)